MEKLVDDHYYPSSVPQVNEQHLSLLQLVPYPHNKSPELKLRLFIKSKMISHTRMFCTVCKFCARTTPKISIANDGSFYELIFDSRKRSFISSTC